MDVVATAKKLGSVDFYIDTLNNRLIVLDKKKLDIECIELPECNYPNRIRLMHSLLEICGLYKALIGGHARCSLNLDTQPEIILDMHDIKIGLSMKNRTAEEHLKMVTETVDFILSSTIISGTVRIISKDETGFNKPSVIINETSEFKESDFSNIENSVRLLFDETMKTPSDGTQLPALPRPISPQKLEEAQNAVHEEGIELIQAALSSMENQSSVEKEENS